MLVVLDRNVLFSALLSSTGRPHLIYEAWREGRFELATCPEQIEEIRRASRYPKFRGILQPHLVGLMLNHMHRAQIVERVPEKHKANDETDSYLLNLADAIHVHYLVTGDKRAGLLERRRIGTTIIATASKFCEDLRI